MNAQFTKFEEKLNENMMKIDKTLQPISELITRYNKLEEFTYSNISSIHALQLLSNERITALEQKSSQMKKLASKDLISSIEKRIVKVEESRQEKSNSDKAKTQEEVERYNNILLGINMMDSKYSSMLLKMEELQGKTDNLIIEMAQYKSNLLMAPAKENEKRNENNIEQLAKKEIIDCNVLLLFDSNGKFIKEDLLEKNKT